MEFNLENKREEIINYLYQYDLLNKTEITIEDEEVLEIFNHIIEEINDIDDVIVNTLFNYTIERLSFVDRAIIRLATYELKYTEIPAAIIINEAIEITKKISDLDDGKQHKFTNKLLDNINKNVRG
ncbi:MAG TPA: transcription antitermination protein NusB [Acholeplasmataceae bacterium]|nr:transcription antitermination protein NusB [Acholeplasmataceae bacterium]